MGLGKTVATLTAIDVLMNQEVEIDSVLVIAPKRVAENVWSAEVDKWEHLRHLTISKIVGTESQRKKALAKKADIHLLGRDNTVWLCGQFGGNMLPYDMLVIDESSSFKNPASLRFKALRRVRASFDRTVLLTGTPAPNGLIDLWPQMFLLDEGERLSKTISSYRAEYFTPGQRNGAIVYNYKLRKESEAKIHDKIKDICMSMKAEDYIDMPERIHNVIKLKLPEAIRKQYLEFEREQVLELLDKEQDISAVNAAALSNKLLQFANGAVYDEDKNYHEVHRVKLEALKEIMEDANGKPVLVAWTYRHDMYRMLEYFKEYEPVCLKTNKHIEAWNAGKIKMLLMHPATGGHGLNLQAGGNIIVWFGQTWSLELYQQLNARLYRQGQTQATVVINHLAVEGTLDIDVMRSIKNKSGTQAGLLQAIKTRIEKYDSYRK